MRQNSESAMHTNKLCYLYYICVAFYTYRLYYICKQILLFYTIGIKSLWDILPTIYSMHFFFVRAFKTPYATPTIMYWFFLHIFHWDCAWFCMSHSMFYLNFISSFTLHSNLLVFRFLFILNDCSCIHKKKPSESISKMDLVAY